MTTTTLERPITSPEPVELPRAPEFPRATDFPKAGQVRFVELQARRCVTVDGLGEPGGTEFQAAVQALYAVAYGLHFNLRARGIEARIGTLEGLWDRGPETPCIPPEAEGISVNTDAWCWTLLIEIPEDVTDEELNAARRDADMRHPSAALDRLRDFTFEEGRVVEALHVGPYATEPETIAKMEAAVATRGLRLRNPHHEIYLGDPRRAAPERLRTVLRLPIA